MKAAGRNEGGALQSVKYRLVLAFCLIPALLYAVIFQGGALATRSYMNEASLQAGTALRLAVSALSGHLSRYEPLPALIADHDDIKELVSASERRGAARSCQSLSQGDQRAAEILRHLRDDAGWRDDRRQQLRSARKLRRPEFQLPALFPGGDRRAGSRGSMRSAPPR